MATGYTVCLKISRCNITPPSILWEEDVTYSGKFITIFMRKNRATRLATSTTNMLSRQAALQSDDMVQTEHVFQAGCPPYPVCTHESGNFRRLEIAPKDEPDMWRTTIFSEDLNDFF